MKTSGGDAKWCITASEAWATARTNGSGQTTIGTPRPTLSRMTMLTAGLLARGLADRAAFPG